VRQYRYGGDLERGGDGYSPAFTSSGVPRISDVQQARIDEDARMAEENMQRLVQLGEAFGDRVGDAFFNIASGTQSARQALAAMISEFARMASQKAFSGLFGSIAGGFGTTPAQATPQPGVSVTTPGS
jgi:hypothetical protein